jgi:hypothetical protein
MKQSRGPEILYRVATAVMLAISVSLSSLPAHAETATSSGAVTDVVSNHCIDCHGGEDPKGDFSLDDVGALSPDHWELVLEQVATGEMPPKKKKNTQPTPVDREAMVAWIMEALAKSGRSPVLPGGPLPTDGNLVDHEQLFSGLHKGPASSPPRFWRRSQPQYDALMEQLWVIPKLRYEKAHRRNDPEWAAYSYSHPFPALDPRNFTNYSAGVHADEATLRALMNAGGQIAERLTTEAPAYSKEHHPAFAVGIPSIRRGSHWEKFTIKPPALPIEFEPFLETDKDTPGSEQQRAAVSRVFRIVLDRSPGDGETQRYENLLDRSIQKGSPLAALRGLITAVVVSPEFVFRMELGRGPEDEYGRRMLSPHELAYALGYSLTDAGPDHALWEAAQNGRLKTRADVEREARRILGDATLEKNRKLRFFQEFFGYHRAGEVFKDKSGWNHDVPYLVRDADMLVEHVLQKDRQVFSELLTTDRYFVAYPFIANAKLFEAIVEHTTEGTIAGIERNKARGRDIEAPKSGKYSREWAYLQGRTLIPRTVHNDRASSEIQYIKVYGFDGATFNWSSDQPIKVPGRRAGILTHPAWLVAHSTNFDNDIVRRGHWIRENLLAGKIPDVPIDVEAQVPDEPDSTLRERMRVTQAERCIRCHTRMDPLGFPFEIYDHYGHFREKEMVGARDNNAMPIDPRGEILESGEDLLDGPVTDAIDLVHKLARSPRVRQSFVRHAFRFWMGRNETLDDSPTLMAADNAYLENDGSFNELLVSLLTSDSFLYRK